MRHAQCEINISTAFPSLFILFFNKSNTRKLLREAVKSITLAEKKGEIFLVSLPTGSVYCVAASMVTGIFPLTEWSAFSWAFQFARSCLFFSVKVIYFPFSFWSRSVNSKSTEITAGFIAFLDNHEWKIAEFERRNWSSKEERWRFLSEAIEGKEDNYRGGIVEKGLCHPGGRLKVEQMHRK